VVGKDDSLYRGEQIPFEHLTKLKNQNLNQTHTDHYFLILMNEPVRYVLFHVVL